MLSLCVQFLDDVFWASLSAGRPNTFPKPCDTEYIFFGKDGTWSTPSTYAFRILSSSLPYGGEKFVKKEKGESEGEVPQRKDGHFESSGWKERVMRLELTGQYGGIKSPVRGTSAGLREWPREWPGLISVHAKVECAKRS